MIDVEGTPIIYQCKHAYIDILSSTLLIAVNWVSQHIFFAFQDLRKRYILRAFYHKKEPYATNDCSWQPTFRARITKWLFGVGDKLWWPISVSNYEGIWIEQRRLIITGRAGTYSPVGLDNCPPTCPFSATIDSIKFNNTRSATLNKYITDVKRAGWRFTCACS